MGKVVGKRQLLRHARQILAREGDTVAKRKAAYLHLKERLGTLEGSATPLLQGPLFVVCIAQALYYFPTFYEHAVTRRRKVVAWRTPAEEWWEGRESQWAQCSRIGCKMAQNGHKGACTFLEVDDAIKVMYFVSNDHTPHVARGKVIRRSGKHTVLVRYMDGDKEELDLRVAQWKYCGSKR